MYASIQNTDDGTNHMVLEFAGKWNFIEIQVNTTNNGSFLWSKEFGANSTKLKEKILMIGVGVSSACESIAKLEQPRNTDKKSNRWA